MKKFIGASFFLAAIPFLVWISILALLTSREPEEILEIAAEVLT